MYKSVQAIALSVAISSSTVANAEDMRVCNTTPNDLSLAYGFVAKDGNLRSGGWYRVSSGRCMNLLTNTNPSDKYYFYAATSSDDSPASGARVRMH